MPTENSPRSDGGCRILCSTAGESVGVDFSDVMICGNMGLALDEGEDAQRGGRVVRRIGFHGLYVVFYEPWALDIKLEEFENDELLFVSMGLGKGIRVGSEFF
ncbi:uncharacterized protein EV420DRAFT_1696791 [Desarmillaria tabescens]|uniref:Helicase C-terminal domain-containing protein n=1 Tax=Armillaria tabescens TaxID=1929756 RepID=A0AA39N1J6_ARMTA|nr:uncharacterized protein EV420DRAFT_1696791 [Desarmillaria tabescens]KAK0454098.1 hypothetical protein EV420DRAFT_1696791 [Desarmillaria tabescens]